MRNAKSIFIVGLLAAFCIALTTVSGFTQDKAAGTGDVVEVVVLPGTQIFPVSVMQLKGFDRKHGFAVTLPEAAKRTEFLPRETPFAE